MGSNSIRLTVYDIGSSGFKILFKEKIMAGLAGYVEQGRLNQDGIDCACSSLREFQNTLKLLEISDLAVFATASLRNITNTQEATEQIYRATGIQVKVLSGEEEAKYGFYGAAFDVEENDGLFADIGGASAELAFYSDRKLRYGISIPVGSLKLYRDCVKNILPGKESLKRIDAAIQKAFENDMLELIPERKNLVCVGGTARACLKFCRKLFGIPEDSRFFTREQLDSLAERLCRNDRETSDLILRYEPERIHTMVPGLLILKYLVNRFGVETITISSYGVREGYLSKIIQPTLSDIG